MTLDSGVMLAAVGGGAGQLAARVVARAGPGLRSVAFDTDGVALSALKGLEHRLLGAVRLEGVGTGGDPVNGRLAAQDDARMIGAAFSEARMAVVLTTLAGGTGGGATAEILKLARQAGVTTLCFAIMPFRFEGARRFAAAERALPLLEDSADALVTIGNDDLHGSKGTETIEAAMTHAASEIELGLLMLWRMLSRPGFIRLDESTMRSLLARAGGLCRYGHAAAEGSQRSSRAMTALMTGPMLRAGAAVAEARALLIGVFGSEDLRLSEVSDVMDRLQTKARRDCIMRLGTVVHPDAGDRLHVVVLAFENWSADDGPSEPPIAEIMAPSTGRTGPRPESKLSFGATGRGRFNDVEPTVMGGEDMDVPTFKRRRIVLEP